MTADPRIAVVAEALFATDALDLLDRRECGIAAGVAWSAVASLIEADVREAIAQAIEAWCCDHHGGSVRLTRPCHKCAESARIARNGGTT